MNSTAVRWCIATLVCCFALTAGVQEGRSQIGKEVAIPRHLQDGEEYQITIPQLIAFGEKLFTAKWTIQEGQGRPNIKGTAAGPRLSNPREPLVFPRNFNRISGPDSNSCSGCHNEPFVGGGGDRATDVFVLGQRFDFVTFDRNDMSCDQGRGRTSVGNRHASNNCQRAQDHRHERFRLYRDAGAADDR